MSMHLVQRPLPPSQRSRKGKRGFRKMSYPEGPSQKKRKTPEKNSLVKIWQPGDLDFLLGFVLPELLAAWFFYFWKDDLLRKMATERLKMLCSTAEENCEMMLGPFVKHFGEFSAYHQISGFDWAELYERAKPHETIDNTSLQGFLQTVVRQTELKLKILQQKYPRDKPFPKPPLVLGEDTHGEQLYSGFFFFQYPVLQLTGGGHLYYSTHKLDQQGELVAGSAREYRGVPPHSRAGELQGDLYSALLASFAGLEVRKLTFLCPVVLGRERELLLRDFPLFMPDEAIYTVHGLASAVLDFWRSTANQPEARDEGEEIYLNGLTVEVHDLSATDLKVQVVVSTRFPGRLHQKFVFQFGAASEALRKQEGSDLWFERHLLVSPTLGAPHEAPEDRFLRKRDEQEQLSWVRPLVVLMASHLFFGSVRREDSVKRLQLRHLDDWRNGTVEEKYLHALSGEIGRRLQKSWDQGLERQGNAGPGYWGETKEALAAPPGSLALTKETIYEDTARGIQVWRARFQPFSPTGSTTTRAFRQLLARVEAGLVACPVLDSLQAAREQPDPSKPAWYAHTSRWGLTRRKIMTLQPREALQRQGAARSGYSFSGQRTVGACWNEVDGFEELAACLEATFEQDFDLCHANLYRARDEKGKLPAISRHSDDEGDLQEGAPIVCLSLGNCPMRLALFEKPSARSSGARVAQTVLEPGSLYVMAGTTQKFLEHHVQPATEKEIREHEQSPGASKVEDKSQRLRLSLTFRKRQI